MQALLFSNSTNAGEEYLSYTLPYMRQFLGDESLTICFIPYAGVSIDFDDYSQRVMQSLHELRHTIIPIHTTANPKKALEEADCIMTGGGNTFHLVHLLQKNQLIEVIRNKVLQGTKYIGWSAGSNIFCPRLSTTNDMPIIEPQSFETLNLVPFQINPHYTDAHPEKHAGETRQMRIEEFLQINPSGKVVGLRESSLLHIDEDKMLIKGKQPCTLFTFTDKPKHFKPDSDLSFLL